MNLLSNVQGRSPWLHLPTLDLHKIHDGLLLAIVCNGAIYSESVPQDLVRALIQQVKYGIERTARIPSLTTTTDAAAGLMKKDIEELMSLSMLYTLMVWHAGPQERLCSGRLQRALRACKTI